MPPSIVQTYDTWGVAGEKTIALDSRTTTHTPVAFRKSNSVHRKVSYHHNPLAENHHFGTTHPMKPWRLTLTNQLVLGYGIQDYMDCYATRPATEQELGDFHTSDYLDFLKRVTPENADSFINQLPRFNIGDDCPIFSGIWDFCTLYAGASLDAAKKLLNGQSEIAINWSGGLHHAKKSEASAVQQSTNT